MAGEWENASWQRRSLCERDINIFRVAVSEDEGAVRFEELMDVQTHERDIRVRS
jgi:hypothetical protein